MKNFKIIVIFALALVNFQSSAYTGDELLRRCDCRYVKKTFLKSKKGFNFLVGEVSCDCTFFELTRATVSCSYKKGRPLPSVAECADDNKVKSLGLSKDVHQKLNFKDYEKARKATSGSGVGREQ